MIAITLLEDPKKDAGQKSDFGQNLRVLVPLTFLELAVAVTWVSDAGFFEHLVGT